MAEIADRAGVSRATLYNYFSSRDELLDALRELALTEIAARLDRAQLNVVDFAVGVGRLTATLISGGARLAVLVPPGDGKIRGTAETLLRPHLEQLFRRGQENGDLNELFTVEMLFSSYVALVKSAIVLSREPSFDATTIAEQVSTLFLRGAQRNK